MLVMLSLLACQDQTDLADPQPPQPSPADVSGDAFIEPGSGEPGSGGSGEAPGSDSPGASAAGDPGDGAPGSGGSGAFPGSELGGPGVTDGTAVGAGGEAGDGDPGSGGASGSDDGIIEMIPPLLTPPLLADPPDTDWWGPAAELVLTAEEAKAMLIGEWTQVREPSLVQHIKLLSLAMVEPRMPVDALRAEGLSAEEAAYVSSLADVSADPETRESLLQEYADRAFPVTLTITAETVTINTNEATRTTPYTVKSIYNDQVVFGATGIGGVSVSTMVTFLDADRIRVQPNLDDPLTLRFAR